MAARAAAAPGPKRRVEKPGEAAFSGESDEAPGPERRAENQSVERKNRVKSRSAARGAVAPWTKASSGKWQPLDQSVERETTAPGPERRVGNMIEWETWW